MIDPRPYTYEYRKPRLNNPTYQSSNLYESLYHLRIPSKNQYFFPRENKQTLLPKINPQQNDTPRQVNNPERYQLRENQPRYEKSIQRQQSVEPKPKQQFKAYNRSLSVQKDLYNRGDSRQMKMNNLPAGGVQSHLSNYGNNLMRSSQFDRYSVFEKQQKGYNIINCYPKQMASSLRVFPKLTLEDKLIERGRY